MQASKHSFQHIRLSAWIAWLHCASACAATINEEGNKNYYLLKPILDNVSYYIYGSWTSGEAYREHLRSDHTKKLLEFDFKKGIVFNIEPLLVVD